MTGTQLILRQMNEQTIEQRALDGYVNATALCQAARKLFADYSRLGRTRAFLSELETDMGIPIAELIQSVSGGNPDEQGTWVHPQVAIHLAQWLSPKFAVQVVKWVHDWMTGKGAPATAPSGPGNLPYHLRRAIANRNNVPVGHFSILAEMAWLLLGPLESAGYTLPENMLPDGSEGQLFCRMLRDELGIEPKNMPTYLHYYEDGRVVRARAYPEELLPMFRKHLREHWIPRRALTYFQDRDPRAVKHLVTAFPTALPPAGSNGKSQNASSSVSIQ